MNRYICYLIVIERIKIQKKYKKHYLSVFLKLFFIFTIKKKRASGLKKNNPGRKITHISARIIALRNEFSISQKELGIALGVTQTSVQRAEKDNGTLLYEAVIFFADKYNINPAWVMLQENSQVEKLLLKKTVKKK